MFELIRTTEGEISRAEYLRGLVLTGILTLLAVLLFNMLVRINASMDWMTTAIAPFLGMVAAFATFSILYFWSCIFIKRLRALGKPLHFVWIWLGLFFATLLMKLAGYQFETLSIEDGGMLAVINPGIWVFRTLFTGLFLYLVIAGTKQDKA